MSGGWQAFKFKNKQNLSIFNALNHSMKKTALILVLLPFIAFSQERSNTPRWDLTLSVIELLTQMDTLSLQGFTNAFITEEETMRMIDLMDAPEGRKESLRSNPEREQMELNCLRRLGAIKSAGDKAGLNWSNIIKDHSHSTTEVRDGLTFLMMDVHFLEGDKSGSIDVLGIYIDGKYCMWDLENLQIDQIEEVEFTEEEPEYIEHIEEPEQELPDKIEEGDLVDFPQIEAYFPGGQTEMEMYINDRLQYPPEALDKKIQGRVYVEFIIEIDGTLSHIKVVRGSDPLLNKEALRIVENMPRWVPAMSENKRVRSWYVLPFIFAL